MNNYRRNVSGLIVGLLSFMTVPRLLIASPPADVIKELSPTSEMPAKESAINSTLDTQLGGGISSGVTLLSNVLPAAFGTNATFANDIWGYVSPSGREYAIIGLENAVGFVDITDPVNPVIVETIIGPPSPWRDMKVNGEYCYTVLGNNGTGLEIVDMTNIDNGVVQIIDRSDLNIGFGSAHNIAYNPDSEYLYLSNLSAIDVSDPINPFIEGAWNIPQGCHDMIITSYTSGPNAGREIAYCFSTSNGVIIADVTDKSNIFTISSLVYPNTTLCHNGWLSEDKRYVFIGDEIDELNDPDVTTTTTYVVDVLDVENPLYVTSFTNGSTAVDHNMMVRGDYLFEANYSSGLRIYDTSDINNVIEVGFYDTFPDHNNTDFSGAWGVYTMLPSGVVIVSDRSTGLYVFDTTAATGVISPPAPTVNNLQLNRYLALDPTTNGIQTVAIRIAHQEAGNQVTLKYVTTNGRTQDQINENVFLLQDNPDFRVWSEPTIFVTGCMVSPGNTYQLQATVNGTIFSNAQNLSTVPIPADGRLYGDVVGSFVPTTQSWSASDTLVTANDILAIVKKFQLDPTAPNAPVVDLVPQNPNAIVNSSDILSVVLAFQFAPYPFAQPNGCP